MAPGRDPDLAFLPGLEVCPVVCPLFWTDIRPSHPEDLSAHGESLSVTLQLSLPPFGE